MESGIRDWETIEAALDELARQTDRFLPSVGEFIALCRQAELRDWVIPTEPEAYGILCRFMGPRMASGERDFTQLNPAVYAAYKRLDWSVVSQMPTKDQRKAFTEAWKLVMADIERKRPLPRAEPPVVAISPPNPKRCPRNKEIGSQTLTDLLGGLGD